MATGILGMRELLSGANIISESSCGEAVFESQLVTFDGKPVTAYGGISLAPEGSLSEYKKPDVVILPAFFWDNGPPKLRSPELAHWLVDQHKGGTTLAAMCTGVFALAETGLLDGRAATTNWMFRNEFRRTYPKVNLMPEKMVTEEGNILCSGAIMASFRMLLRIIERFGSRELMLHCARGMLVDPAMENQHPFMRFIPERTHGDEAITKAQAFIEERCHARLEVTEMANHVAMCPRHFRRRFKRATGSTPAEYLQNLRLEKAKVLLEAGGTPVSQITWEVGYEDPSSFSRSFKRLTGMSPLKYRETFGVAATG